MTGRVRVQWLRGAFLLLALAATTAIAIPGVVGSVEPPPGTTEEATSSSTQSLKAIEERLGIEVMGVRRSAHGYMLDFRYRVIHPARARVLMDKQDKPYLIDERDGSAMLVPSNPKVGPMRQTTVEPIQGRVYYIMFANPAQHVKPGDPVTIVVGDVKIENLTVLGGSQ